MEHATQTTAPQERQWCRLRESPKGSSQRMQSFDSSSRIHSVATVTMV
jgi:hypothetical protein